jgi:hypothetical protein
MAHCCEAGERFRRDAVAGRIEETEIAAGGADFIGRTGGANVISG